MRVFVVALIVLLAAFSSTQILEAQQPTRGDSSSRDSLRNGNAFPLPPIVVTATVEPVRQDRIGFVSSVVTETDFANETAALAAQILRRLPDVFVDEAAGPGGPAVLRIRGGEEPYTKVLWDGVPINISGGFLDIQGLTLSNVERVEVARGPHSALHGASAMSGVVQFITRRGAVGRPVFDASWEGGTATKYGEVGRGELAVRGGTSKLLYSAGGAVAYDRGIYTLPHNAWTKEGSLRLDAKPSARFDLVGTARYGDIKTNLPVRNPGVTRAPLDPNQRDSRHRLTTSLAGTYHLSPSWTHRFLAGYLKDDFYYGDMTDGVMQPGTFFVPDFTLTDHASTHRVTLEYSGTNRFGTTNNGAAWSYGASMETENTGDHLTGDFGNSDLDFHQNGRALFTELQAPLGERVTILAGTRLEKFRDLPVQLTPRGSVVLSAVPNQFLLRAAVGRSYKVPNAQQQYLDNPFSVPNPNLAPETAISWEFGATLTPASAPVRASVTYFHQYYRNLIRTVPAPNSTKQTNQNLGKSAAQGFEVELSYRPSAPVTLGTNATWVTTEVQENTGLSPAQYPIGEELPFRPHSFGSAYADINWGRVYTSVRGTFVGTQTVLTERFSGQRAPVSGYTILGLTVSYTASRALSLYVRGENLFDTTYHTAFDMPGVPLRLTAGIHLTS